MSYLLSYNALIENFIPCRDWLLALELSPLASPPALDKDNWLPGRDTTRSVSPDPNLTPDSNKPRPCRASNAACCSDSSLVVKKSLLWKKRPPNLSFAEYPWAICVVMYCGGGSLYRWQKSCRLLLKEMNAASPGPGTVKQAMDKNKSITLRFE